MTEVQGKRVLVVGLARSGRAVALCLARRGAVVTVTERRPPADFQAEIPELAARKIGLEVGQHCRERFLRQDLIVVSPGVPWNLPELEAARQRGIQVVPEIEVASWFLNGCLIGITGTNGKTTTTALLGKILEASNLPVFVGGNIGRPLISAVDQVPARPLLLAELSSFQLEAIQNLRPHVAVLLNLTPNHLDRHASFNDYVRAKARIFRNQTADDFAILNADDPIVMSLAPAIASQKLFFSCRHELPEGVFVSDGHVRYRVRHLERGLLATGEVALRGAFNLENVLAAATVACVLGAELTALREAVREFRGVEHRLEFVGKIRGVEFFNDSKATSVDATAKALSAFERGVHLILGGKDKGAPYGPLRPLLEGRVQRVYLIGAAAERVARELDGAVELIHPGDLETAVRKAFEQASPGDVVLLAPACASFDQFENFEHRGRVFREIVGRLAREEEMAEAAMQEQQRLSRQPPPVIVQTLPPDQAQETLVEPAAPASMGEGPLATEHVSAESREKQLGLAATGPLGPVPEPEPASGPGVGVGESSAKVSLAEERAAEDRSGTGDEALAVLEATPLSVASPKPLEPVLVYEVEANEVDPLNIEGSQENEEEELFVEGVCQGEAVEDEPLPFEVRSTGKAPTNPDEGSPVNSSEPAAPAEFVNPDWEGNTAAGAGRTSRRGGRSTQPRLPGI